MSLKKNSHFVLLGGFPNETTGRALGPYRVRTVLENHGYTCSLVDFEDILSQEELEKILNYVVGPDTLAIGISYTWGMVRWSTEDQINKFSELKRKLKIKFPNIKVVIGAATMNRTPPKLLNTCDWVVTGFVELSMPLLMDHLKNGSSELKFIRVKTSQFDVNYVDSDKDYIISDTHLMFTKFNKDDFFEPYQPLSIEISRGCVFNCAFCRFAFKNKKIKDYVRTASSLAEELRQNYDLFGTTRYMLADDTFNDSIEKIDTLRKAVELAKLPDFEYCTFIRPEMFVTRPAMIKALAQSGIRGAHFGIESGNNSTRKLIGRPITIEKVMEATAELKNLAPKLRIEGTLIVGLPGDTKEDPGRWNEMFVANQPNFLDWWHYAPLALHKNNLTKTIVFGKNLDEVNAIDLSDSTKSPIEENPQKYGYDISDMYRDDITHRWWADTEAINWKNKYMTYEEAIPLAHQYTMQKWEHYRWGGWRIGTAWYNNIPEDLLDNKNYKQLSDLAETNRKLSEHLHRKNHWLNIVDQESSHIQ